MFTLILVYLLFPVKGSKANIETGSSALKKTCQQDNYCITLKKDVITAEAGLCVVIPCSFTTDPTNTATNIIWFKCQTGNANCGNSEKIFNTHGTVDVTQPEFKGRVSLLEPGVSQKKCSIIISDLRESDSGFYQLRVVGIGGFTFQRKAVLSVKDLTQKPTVMVPPLTEGQQTTLSCTAPGLCSGSAPKFTWMWGGGGGQNESKVKIDIKTDPVSAIEQRHSSSLTFTPTAEHHGTDITCKVIFKNNISTDKTETLNVTYVKDPVISGERAVKLGDALNLTCSVDSFPPSVVTWTKLNSNQTRKKDTRTAKLIIPKMTAEDVGKYICTASQQSTNQTAHTEVNVTILTSILNSSTCEFQSEILTCVCVSQGFPLPTIEWPLLKNHTQHCVTTRTINNTIHNNISVSVKDRNYTTVMCVSKNKFGEVKEDLEVVIKNVTKSELKEKKDDLIQNLSEKIIQPQVLIAFLIGLLLSAVVCCAVQKCHRKKQKRSQNVSKENLEMIDVDPTLVGGERHGHDRAEGGAEAEADEEQREVEYSDINFDLLRRGRPIGAEKSNETSEYAEIKKDKANRIQANDGKDGEIVERNKEEEVMVEGRKNNVAETDEEEEEEEEALYSNVTDLMKKA